MIPILRGLDRAELDTVLDATCAVATDDWIIRYVNPAWTEFARANGARTVWGVGDDLLAAISGPLRSFHAEHLGRVAATGEAWEHDYECSSASVYREFRLRALVVADGEGVLITHALRVERPHVLPAAIAGAYRPEQGLIAQCGHCRRVRRVAPPRTWDWVPSLLEADQEGMSHGLCELCLAYYFGPADVA